MCRWIGEWLINKQGKRLQSRIMKEWRKQEKKTIFTDLSFSRGNSFVNLLPWICQLQRYNYNYKLSDDIPFSIRQR